MQAALNPANLKLHQNGKLFNLKETLQLIKKGVKIPSNTRYDPAFTKAFGIFPKEVYLANYMKPIRSSTLVAKRKNGAALGEQFSLSDDGTGVILVLNKIFQNERSLVRRCSARLLPQCSLYWQESGRT